MRAQNMQTKKEEMHKAKHEDNQALGDQANARRVTQLMKARAPPQGGGLRVATD